MTTTNPPAPQTDPDTSAPVAPDSDLTSSQWARVGILGALVVLLVATTGIWGLVVVLGIILMVFLHELGHYVAAKKAGMKVTEFFIGFGPRIWSFSKGETEYGLKAIPAGAYVKIIGMHNLDEIDDPADEARTYRQASLKDRLCTVLAGVAMNFAVATLLLWGLLAFFGLPGGSLREERADLTKWSVAAVTPGTGAAEVGLQAGDRVTEVDGEPIVEMTDLKVALAPYRQRLVTGEVEEIIVPVTFVRDGTERTVDLPLRPYLDDEGATQCCLGIGQNLDLVTVNPAMAVPLAFVEMGDITYQSVLGLGRFFSPTGLRNFGGQVADARDEEPPAAVTTTVPATSPAPTTSAEEEKSKDRLLSIVGFFRIGTDVADSGWATLMVLFVVLNIGLGVINLVPLLPFDGGHTVIAIYERIQERRRHLSGRYFTDVSKLMPLTYMVVAILLAIFVTTTYLDLLDPLQVD